MKSFIIFLIVIQMSCTNNNNVVPNEEENQNPPAKLSDLKFNKKTGELIYSENNNIKILDRKANDVNLRELFHVWPNLSDKLLSTKGDAMEEILRYAGKNLWYVSIQDIADFELTANDENKVKKYFQKCNSSNLMKSGTGSLTGFFHSKQFDLLLVTIKINNWKCIIQKEIQILPANSIPPRPVAN